MKVYYTLIISALMLISLFSFALVSAEKGQGLGLGKMTGKALDAPRNGQMGRAMYARESLAALNESDAEDSFDELARGNMKRLGFALMTNGHGWATSSNNGTLLSIMYLSQEFTNSTNNSTVEKTIGRLMLNSFGQYRLQLTDSDNSILDFDVYALDSDTKVGTLSLDKVKTFSNMTTWNGTLSLDGKNWDVELATTSNNFKSQGNLAHGQKVGFWKKLMFWNKK